LVSSNPTAHKEPDIVDIVDVVDFAGALERLDDKDKEPLVRWADRVSEYLATEALYLAPHFEELPSGLKDHYISLLERLLRAAPENTNIEVSRQLYDVLKTLNAPDEVGELVRERVLAPTRPTTNGHSR
jgi:hypothetical protein